MNVYSVINAISGMQHDDTIFYVYDTEMANLSSNGFTMLLSYMHQMMSSKPIGLGELYLKRFYGNNCHKKK